MPLRRALLTLWFLPHTLLAIGGPLPVDSELAAQRDIELELHNASVSVVVDPTARPWIKATSTQAKSSGAPELAFDWTEGPLRVVRSDGFDGAERIRVEINISPSQRLVVQGIDIDLRVAAADSFDAARDPEDDEEDAPPPAPNTQGQAVAAARPRQRTPTQPDNGDSPYRVEIGVEGGQVDVAGLRDVLIAAVGAVVRTSDTGGNLKLTVTEGSEAEILAHHGPSDIKGISSDLALVDSVTNAIFELDSTNTILRDGRGTLAVNSRGALVVLDGWQGHTRLIARDGPMEIRGGTGNANLTIAGAGLDVVLDGWQGKMSFKQSGGSLRATGWEGIADVHVENGTDLDLSSVSGPLTLTMKSNSRGRIEGLVGQLKAEIANAELEFHQITTLHLKAQQSTLVGSGVGRLNHFEVASSRVDLDLTETLGRPTIRLRRKTRADVRMATPCFVVMDEDKRSALTSQVTVNGCELLNGRNLVGRRGGLAASRHFLNATLAPDAELDVEGIP